MNHSQVMETVSWLTDVYGPRLTGSPNFKAACDWAVSTLRSWGLEARLEAGGAFERSWRAERLSFHAMSPQPFLITALPSVWSPSTPGHVIGPAIMFDAHSLADMQRRFSGKLKNAFLLMGPAHPTPAHFSPQAERLSDARLETLTRPAPPRPGKVIEMRYVDRLIEDPAVRQWLVDQGTAALLFPAAGDGGTIELSGPGTSASQTKKPSFQLPMLKVSAESYGRIVRILEKNIPVTLELEMQNSFYDDREQFNVIADLPGVDPTLKSEVVMIGAHLDSWTFGTGATDNAAGSAVVMEAMRVLKVLRLQPRRTVRMALWCGEEVGHCGSEHYLQQHLRRSSPAERANSPADNAEYDQFSVYFNLDGGTGKIRGLWNVHNPALAPIFLAWMAPFNAMGMRTVSPRDVGGGDQAVFEGAGLPSFGFIQDPIEYNTRTHHTSADVYERIQPEDLQFNSMILASFAWQAAQRAEKLPRTTKAL